jgi:phosphoribosylanthranilate isomerase
LPVIKTVKMPPASTVAGMAEYRITDTLMAVRYQKVAAAVLLDSAARWSEGAAREPLEWRLAAWVVTQMAVRRGLPRVILSAGLTPETVARAVSLVKPYGVDVNSGVEASPGRKDVDKVCRFVAAARSAA